MKYAWIVPCLIFAQAGLVPARPNPGPSRKPATRRVAHNSAPVQPVRIHKPVLEQVNDLRSDQGMTIRQIKPIWKNPQVGDPGVLERGGVPEGMMLIGADGKPATRLDPHKATVIYIHGWTPDSLPDFPYVRQWNEAGFNTLIFRYHKRAHTGFLQAYNLAASKQLMDEFNHRFLELRRLLDQGELGSYTKEIRFVGYSLGASLAINSGYKLFYEDQPYAALDWKMKYPRRIDLLEPAFVDSFMQADQVTLADPQGTVATSSVVNRAEVGKPRLLNGWGVKVVSFVSSLGRTLAPHLDRTMTTQQMGEEWTPTNAAPNDSDQHVKILDYYFSSIATSPARIADSGRKPLSARTPTAELPGRTQARIVQIAGEKTLTPSDDVYEAETVSTTRGGVLVDQDAFKTHNDTRKNTVITIPVWQSGY